MSYPDNKGFVRARVVSTTPPDDKAAMWAVGPDEDNITDYRFCINGDWISYKLLLGIFHESQTTPGVDYRNKIWVQVDGSGNVVEFHRYVYGSSNAWVPFSELYFGAHRGTSAPSDTRKIWLEVDGSNNLLAVRAYDPALSKWIRLDGLSTRTKASGNLVASESNKILYVEDNTEITIPAGLPADFNCAIVLTDFGATDSFDVVASGNVFLNGVEENTYRVTRACTLIPTAQNYFIIIGNLE